MSDTRKETVTLYAIVGDFADEVEVGEFRKRQWCKTHADFKAHLVPFDGRHCRWALKVDGSKPCELVELWQEQPK